MIRKSIVFLVKHFFDPVIARQYAAISIIGRSIFYAVSPIAIVMLPLVARKKERGKSLMGITLLLNLFYLSIGKISVFVITILAAVFELVR